MNDKKYEIVKFVDGELELEINVSPKEETIWMTLDQIALLFDRDKSVISRHIKKIYLNEKSPRLLLKNRGIYCIILLLNFCQTLSDLWR